MTFWETIQRGEYVMFALALIFIAIIMIWSVRGAKLRIEAKQGVKLMPRLRDHITESDVENARQICRSSDTPGGRVLASGLNHIGSPMEEIQKNLKHTTDTEKEDFRRGILWLRLFSIVSPLLGLGGTLVGVIDVLRDLGLQESPVTTAQVSGGIAPTIVTTVAGIGVGIFALVALASLNSQVLRAGRNLNNLSQSFIDLLNEPS